MASKMLRRVVEMRLYDVLRDIHNGEFVVPEFQREFEWNAEDIRQLIYSVFSEYDIGSLLLWPTNEKRSRDLQCENLFGFRDRSHKPDAQWIVLDGQQRLSALHYAFFGAQVEVPVRGSSEREAVRFAVDIAKFMDEGADEFQRRSAIKIQRVGHAGAKSGDDALEYPLGAVGERLTGSDRYLDDLVRELERNVEAAKKNHELLNENLSPEPKEEAGRHLRECQRKLRDAKAFREWLGNLLPEFPLSKVEIDKDAPIDRVVDLFVQINRQGKPLSPFGRLNAAASLYGLPVTRLLRKLNQSDLGMDRTHIETALLRMMMIRAHPESRYDTGEDADRLLPGASSRRSGGRPLVEDEVQLLDLWDEAVADLAAGVSGMRSATGGYGVVDASANLPGGHVPGFPYVAMIPVFCTLYADAQGDSAKEQKVRQWYWASALTDRYNSESPLGRADLEEVRIWFENDQETPGAVRHIREHFGIAELDGVRDGEKASRSQRVRHHVLLNLMYAFQPRDWQSNVAVRLESIEAKLLVPAQWCQENGVLRRSQFSPFNHVLLERDTAERLGDRLPSSTLPELLRAWSYETKERLLESHFISEEAEAILMREPLTSADLDEFLHERAVTLLRQVGRDLFQTDLAVLPAMRELDRRITRIERTMRDIVARRYNAHGRDIPDQIRRELNQARQRQGLQQTSDLRSHLEFATLSDLRFSVDGAWRTFSDLFADAGSGDGYDGLEFHASMRDLAALRNPMRHARSVDRVTLSKGESAVLWLEDRCGQDTV